MFNKSKVKKYIVCPGQLPVVGNKKTAVFVTTRELMKQHDLCFCECVCLDDFETNQDFIDRLKMNDLWKIVPGMGPLASHQRKHTKRTYERKQRHGLAMASIFGKG